MNQFELDREKEKTDIDDIEFCTDCDQWEKWCDCPSD